MLPSRLFFDNMLDDFSVNDKIKCDIYEKNGNYYVEADIPGFKKEDIKIEFNKGTLTITAEKKEEEVEEKKYIRRERNYTGTYQRSFYLGDVEEEEINASFDNGSLKIEVPKKQEQNTKRQIEIK